MSAIEVVASLPELRALDTATVKVAELVAGSRSGKFVWTPGDFTTISGVDVHNAIYVVSDTVAISSGAWVRQRDHLDVHVEWSGATGDGVTDDAVAIQNSINLAMRTNSAVLFSAKNYKINSTLTVHGAVFGWRSVRFRCDSATGNHLTVSSGGACIVTHGTYNALEVTFHTFANENFGVKGVSFFNAAFDRVNGGIAIKMIRGNNNNRYISGHVFEDVSIVGFGAGIGFFGSHATSTALNFFGTISLLRVNVNACGIGWFQFNSGCNLVSMYDCLFFDIPYGGISLNAGPYGLGSVISVSLFRCHMEGVAGMFRTCPTPMAYSAGAPPRSKISLHDFTHEVCGSTVTGGTATGDPFCLGVNTDVYIVGVIDNGPAYGESQAPSLGGPTNTLTALSKFKCYSGGVINHSPAGMVTFL